MSEKETGPSSDSYTQTIADIREWLVKIDTNQSHQTKLLETLTQQADNAFTKADTAEDTAEDALRLAETTKKELDDYKRDEASNRRWLIGLVVTVTLALLPIFNSFYIQ